MTKSAVTDWSTTAASNTDVGGIGIEGSNTISNFDNAIREIMAQIATWITSATFTGGVTLTSTDAGATAGPTLTLYRDSASPAASDLLGKVLFQGEDSAGNTQDYAEIYSVITDATSASEDANLLFRNIVAGTMTTQATVSSTGWNNMNIGATTAGTGRFSTLTATGNAVLVGVTMTDNLSIQKASSPIIALTSTGTGSDSTITENGAGLTYSADASNEVASSFHLFNVDGTQKFALGASTAVFASGVSVTASGGGSLTGTWTDLGTVSTADINGGTLDNVVIGGSTPAAASVTTLTASGAVSATDTLTLTSADAGAGVGPTLKLYRNSASPAINDLIARLDFAGMDDGGAEQRYGDIYMQVINPAAGSENATMFIRTVVAGTVTTQITLAAAGVTIPNLIASTSLRLPVYTVATLPAAGTAGRTAYASNLRVFNGAGTQEGAGLGTGGTVVDNGTAWKISGTNVTAVA